MKEKYLKPNFEHISVDIKDFITQSQDPSLTEAGQDPYVTVPPSWGADL